MSDTKRGLRHSLIVFEEVEKLTGENLPSCQEVLQVYYYWRNKQKKTKRESARIAVRQCMQFWEHAELKTQQEIRAILKLERIIDDYSKLKKDINHYDDYNVAKRKSFELSIEKLFDIAHQKVMVEATSRAQEFLINQRHPKRKDTLGEIVTADMDNLLLAEKKTNEENPKPVSSNYADYLWFSDENIKELLEETDDNSEDEDFSISVRCSEPKRMKVIDFDTSAALDRGRVSCRDGARILAAFIKNLGYSLDKVSISRETLRRTRKTHRKSGAQAMKESFELDPDDRLFVHWDGKQLPESNNKYEQVDRLPIVISGDIEKLLGIPKINRGTGEEQAKAVVEALKYWTVEKNVCGMVFDTTSANTGVNNGACVNIEKLLGRPLLHCACRHHIFELSLKTAYEKCLGGTSGPDVLLFKRFQSEWIKINEQEYKSGMQDEYIYSKLEKKKEEILSFVHKQLQVT